MDEKQTQSNSGEKKSYSAESVERDWEGFEDVIPETLKKRLETFVPELVKKTFAAGLGAVFSTEDSLRKISKEIPMPKEVAGYLASTASTTKDEFMRILANETREFLQTVNLSTEISKLLSMVSVEVKAEINFKQNKNLEDGVEPNVKSSFQLSSNVNKDGDGEPVATSKRRRRFTRKDNLVG